MSSSTNEKLSLYAAIGTILSVYAIYVEHKMAHKQPDEEFSALCDIESIGASCSSVFQLPEGRMLSYFGLVPSGSILDLPNAALGLVYYSLWMTIMSSLSNRWRMLISSLAMASSIFLAIQLLRLSELCLLCWSTHVINAQLWWGTYSRHRSIQHDKHKKSINRDNPPNKANIKRV